MLHCTHNPQAQGHSIPSPPSLTPMPQHTIAVHPLLVAYPTARSVCMYWEAALVSLHPTQDKIYITGFHWYKEPARQNYSEHEFLLAEIVCHVLDPRTRSTPHLPFMVIPARLCFSPLPESGILPESFGISSVLLPFFRSDFLLCSR